MRILIIVLCILCTQSLSAQSGLPDLSPRAVIKQPVGYTAITLEYGRPAMRGRTIFGEVVPYDKLWRTGASKGTSVTFEHPVTIAKKNIPAGTYAFVTIPGKNEWAVLLNSDASKSYGDPSEYNEKTEVLRFSVPSEKTSRTVESLTIDFDIKNYDAIVYLSWENTQIHFLIETGSDALAMKYIDEKLANSNDADMLANAAFYYNMNGKDPAKAIAFLNKALSIKEDFWYYEEKMTALEKMKNFAEAKKTAAQAISYLRATKPDSWEKVVSRIEARVRKF